MNISQIFFDVSVYDRMPTDCTVRLTRYFVTESLAEWLSAIMRVGLVISSTGTTKMNILQIFFGVKPCTPLSAFLFFCFSFSVFSTPPRGTENLHSLICILYTSRPDYISQRPLLPHTHKKKQALASDTTKR